MIPYDTEFDPPAIILTVVVAGFAHRRPRTELPALIGTGADITAIPESLAERLRLYPIGRLQLEDARAVKTPVFTFEAHLAMIEEPEIKVTHSPR